jgi:hypothetical protein
VKAVSKIRPNPLLSPDAKKLSVEISVLWRELATELNNLIVAFNGIDTGGSGGGQNGNNWGSGVDTTADVIIDSSTSGLVLKDTAGHYWRVKINTSGVLTTTDLGLVKP